MFHEYIAQEFELFHEYIAQLLLQTFFNNRGYIFWGGNNKLSPNKKINPYICLFIDSRVFILISNIKYIDN